MGPRRRTLPVRCQGHGAIRENVYPDYIPLLSGGVTDKMVLNRISDETYLSLTGKRVVFINQYVFFLSVAGFQNQVFGKEEP